MLIKVNYTGHNMFGSTARGANAYAQVGVESGVLGASPHKLVVMLYDGAIGAVAKASIFMKGNNIAEKCKSINHAMTIIDSGLRASLDKQAGGDIAVTLDNLYAHISKRLLLANLRNDPAILVEVTNLLNNMRDSWLAIGPDKAPAPMNYPSAAARAPASAAYNSQRIAA
jgi:flagellar protein FliS